MMYKTSRIDKMVRSLIYLTMVLSTLLLPSVRAQGTSQSHGTNFTCLVMGELPEEIPMDEIFYKEGASYVPIELKRGKRSQKYPLKKAKNFQLYISDDSVKEGDPFKAVGGSRLVEGSKEMLFLIMPVESKEGLPLSVFGVDDSLKGFPPGTFRFVNFTKSGLLVKVKEKITKLPSSEITVVSSQSNSDGGLVPVMFGSLKGEMLHFTRIYSHPRTREMVFIGPTADPQRKFEFKFVPQNIPVPKQNP